MKGMPPAKLYPFSFFPLQNIWKVSEEKWEYSCHGYNHEHLIIYFRKWAKYPPCLG